MGIGGSSGLGRRGMSPLIATVLLMAFAVALGGMIMNWSIDRKASGECDTIQVEVTKFCTQEGKIHLAMRNSKESVPLREIKVNFIQSSIETTFKIVNSQIAPGQYMDEVAIPASVQPGTPVNLIGVVGAEANPITCTEPIATASPIRDC